MLQPEPSPLSRHFKRERLTAKNHQALAGSADRIRNVIACDVHAPSPGVRETPRLAFVRSEQTEIIVNVEDRSDPELRKHTGRVRDITAQG
jgi:hypothetical protein